MEINFLMIFFFVLNLRNRILFDVTINLFDVFDHVGCFNLMKESSVCYWLVRRHNT